LESVLYANDAFLYTSGAICATQRVIPTKLVLARWRPINQRRWLGWFLPSPDGWFVRRAVYSRQLPLEFKPIENYAGQLIMELWETVFERSALDEKQKIDIMFFIYGAVVDLAKLARAGELSDTQREEMFDRILGLLEPS
jgi:hypothetical protein